MTREEAIQLLVDAGFDEATAREMPDDELQRYMPPGTTIVPEPFETPPFPTDVADGQYPAWDPALPIDLTVGEYRDFTTGGWIDPESYWAQGQAAALEAEAKKEAAHQLLIEATGIAALEGVPTNWWPGLNVVPYVPSPHDIFVSDSLSSPTFARGGLMPQEWSTGGAHFQFSDPATGASQPVYVRYDPHTASQQFYGMDDETRRKYNTLLADAGYLGKGFKDVDAYTIDGASMFARALIEANYYGLTVDELLKRQAAIRRTTGGGTGRRVVIEIPDYDTMLADSTTMLRNQLGRDPEDWEMALIADEMKRQYGSYAEAKREAALGNGTYEIPNPETLTQTYLEDQYADEINRIQTREETRVNNRLTLDALTKGRQMIGSYGA